MKLNELKTIDLTAKEWFDKVNGNSYFSARLVLNYGMENQESFVIPFQYGYGDFYLQEAGTVLCKMFDIEYRPIRFLHIDYGIIIRHRIERGCKKRDVMNFTKE